MKSFDLKNIAGVDIYDYINLDENPLYIKIDKNNKSFKLGICIRETPDDGFIKVSSIYEFEREFRKHDFFYDKKSNDRLRYLQGWLR